MIVGVVENVRQRGVESKSLPAACFPYDAEPAPDAKWVQALRIIRLRGGWMADADRGVNERIVSLTEERRGDRALIGQLGGLVHAGQPKPHRPEAGDGAAAHHIGALRRLAAASGGDLNQVIRQILTPEALNATLERHADQPAFWVAAASLCGKPAQAREYLETAAARFPESAMAQAALIEAKRGLPEADEATLAAIENLREADPTSSLADHYDAYFRFKEGDVAGAVQAVAAASEKDRFADHRLELLMSRHQCLRENGCSDGGALALSTFSLGFEHLPMLREVSQQALEQAEAAHAAGRLEPALSTADSVARIGRNLSASGRFLVYDRVGIQLQEAALLAKRRFYDVAGNAHQVGDTDFQLGAIRARASQIGEMVNAFGGVLANMTDEGVVHYVEAAITQGEFATLRGLTHAFVGRPLELVPPVLAEAEPVSERLPDLQAERTQGGFRHVRRRFVSTEPRGLCQTVTSIDPDPPILDVITASQTACKTDTPPGSQQRDERVPALESCATCEDHPGLVHVSRARGCMGPSGWHGECP